MRKLIKKELREHLGIFDTDKPAKLGQNAVNKEVVFIYEIIMENMLTVEESYIVKCRTKLGMQYSELAIILNCSRRTAQRNCERAIKKLQNISEFLDYSKISSVKKMMDQVEKDLRKNG